MALPELAGWKVESLRVTLLANAPLQPSGKNWWQQVTGSAPEIVTNKPHTAEYSESGHFDKGRLEMRVSFNRVDWLYSGEIAPGISAPLLGEATEVADSLNTVLAPWLESQAETEFARMATGLVVLYPVDDVRRANQIISLYMPFFSADSDVAKDILVQINYPISSAVVDGLGVNRIAKFMHVAAQTFNFTVGQPVPVIQTENYCRAEFDMNTDVAWTTSIENNARLPLMKELFAASRDYIENGVRK